MGLAKGHAGESKEWCDDATINDAQTGSNLHPRFLTNRGFQLIGRGARMLQMIDE